ncbi:DUF3800 domain-containing protein [Massilia sp. YIM B04103]|uniref:DUF3800 domain-containing protein n=1 Tax=Massilia sp. YIM B04103 TaxID=2963106 RepID=UPI002109F8CC|nr:DUF3800 domain-containing protein [Massilia sp. YIM B04103]
MDFDVRDLAPEDPRQYGNDQEFTLYYDETNNIRKLLLTERGLNVTKHDNFVLGGIVLRPGQSIGDIEELRRVLWIQKSAEEIKFDLVAKGGFERILDSRKLGQTLSWLLERDIGIHYDNLNILNWSILDIVESVVADKRFGEFLPFHRELKNELHRIVLSDLQSFLAMLRRYGYPDLAEGTAGQFVSEVRQFIQDHWPASAFPATEMLNEMLLRAQSINELAFLAGEKRDYLIEGFEDFYLHRICSFRNSTHVFDEELTVQAAIGGIRILDGGREVPFSFVDSKQVGEIQLSDVVVGFLGKYFTFIEQTPLPALLRKRKELTKVQAANLELLAQLIEISDKTCNVLLHRITTMDSDWKSDAFLFGSKPPPHLLAA